MARSHLRKIAYTIFCLQKTHRVKNSLFCCVLRIPSERCLSLATNIQFIHLRDNFKNGHFQTFRRNWTRGLLLSRPGNHGSALLRLHEKSSPQRTLLSIVVRQVKHACENCSVTRLGDFTTWQQIVSQK